MQGEFVLSDSEEALIFGNDPHQQDADDGPQEIERLTNPPAGGRASKPSGVRCLKFVSQNFISRRLQLHWKMKKQTTS